ncbi:hypothetical protein M758_2G239200 [Ceratodon purpureus]|nr:hypothetical protein M758_2G239200 [Ceratodon purpureus]
MSLCRNLKLNLTHDFAVHSLSSEVPDILTRRCSHDVAPSSADQNPESAMHILFFFKTYPSILEHRFYSGPPSRKAESQPYLGKRQVSTCLPQVLRRRENCDAPAVPWCSG